jgi:hypothetical protein
MRPKGLTRRQQGAYSIAMGVLLTAIAWVEVHAARLGLREVWSWFALGPLLLGVGIGGAIVGSPPKLTWVHRGILLLGATAGLAGTVLLWRELHRSQSEGG